MIDPKELRIGNTVNIGGILMNVDCDIISELVNNSESKFIQSINPVPITHELLEILEFGINKIDDVGNYIINHNSGWCKLDNFDGYFQHPMGCAKIEHIHQLQNLFFALAGTELTPII